MTERSAAKLIERVEESEGIKLVLIDLTLRSVDLASEIPQLKQAFPGCQILAFGPHVDVERLEAAQQAGADRVLTRGQMDRDLTEILKGE